MVWFLLIMIMLGVLGYLGRGKLKKLLNTSRHVSPERLEFLKKQAEIEEAKTKEIEQKAIEAEALAKDVKVQLDKINNARNKAQAAQEKIRKSNGGL